MTPLTAEQIHAVNHELIVQRVRALLENDIKGRRLDAAREMLAYSIVGHARWWPCCKVRPTFTSTLTLF